MPCRFASTYGSLTTALKTASRSSITLPAQSCVISSTNFWPNPVEPRGLGAATTQPCAAHSDGFQREDQASPQSPCGPPWMRNTTGYFFDASKFGGLISQYCTGVPPAPATVRLSGFSNATSLSHDSFSRVSCVASFDVPSSGAT